ncbi:hypothetical protein V1508DRAFT_421766 [Lipomyces doorenjongii]|uniref:uncharacterized protein n=1 Tax=Lipomyces doorenjongii TaxID=383834 RepID=UPI0034CD3936
MTALILLVIVLQVVIQRHADISLIVKLKAVKGLMDESMFRNFALNLRIDARPRRILQTLISFCVKRQTLQSIVDFGLS